MHNIILIGTVHEECGLCNLDELYKIIKSVNPEVIFEEITLSDFNDHYENKSNYKLETNTIIKYSETFPIKHIPVDIYKKISPSLLGKHRHMHHQIEIRSNIYKDLIDKNTFYKRQFGFKYINSIDCMQNYVELYKEVEIVLKMINNDKFFQINNLWNNFMKKREDKMLDQIYIYCKNNKFEKGIFFIGSAHRESIIYKINKYKEINNVKINWNYSNYENIL